VAHQTTDPLQRIHAVRQVSDLEPYKLRRICEGGLLAIDLKKNGLVDVSPGNDAEYAMMSWILAAIFPKLNETKAKETVEGLRLCERASFFHRTNTAPSRVIGVDPVHKRILMADLATTTPCDSGIEADSLMWFPFKDDDDYKRFISIYESKNAKIPHLKHQSEGVFKASSSEIVVAANLSAYVIFNPSGVGSGSPMEIVWRFGPDFGSDKDIFFTQSTSVHDNKVCIDWQLMNSRLLQGFNEASDTSFKRYSDVLGSIVELYQMILKELMTLSAERACYSATDKPEKMPAESRHPVAEDEEEETDEERLGNYCLHILSASKRCMERNNAEQYTAMQARCRAFYVNQLFPRYDQPDLLASRKLDVLDNHLSPEDFKHLRTWLLRGAAFDKRGSYVVDEHDAPSTAATAARISSICSNVLGIPFVRYQPDSRSITLDLLKI
jgi:hypothetical protein